MLLAPFRIGRAAQDEFLHAPGFDLADDDLVGISAIHHVNPLEARRQLAGMAELADHRAVQLHLVDLAADFPAARGIAVGIGIGNEQILMRSLGDAVGPGAAILVVGGLPFQIVVQHDVAGVAAVGDIDIAGMVHLQAVRQVVFIFAFADFLAAILGEEAAVLVILDHAVVSVTVCDGDVALLVPGDIGGAAQRILLILLVGNLGRGIGTVGLGGAMADHHQHLGAGG